MLPPKTFTYASIAVYISTGITMIHALLLKLQVFESDFDGDSLFGVVLRSAFFVLLGYKIGQAKNWARIVLLYIVAIQVLFMLFGAFVHIDTDRLLDLALLIFAMLPLVAACIFLYTKESRRWISIHKRPPKFRINYMLILEMVVVSACAVGAWRIFDLANPENLGYIIAGYVVLRLLPLVFKLK
uniref:hypothetical protein n=1 Tax=Ekhidna sp. TaxID=2608089 RepID=UPI0032EFDFE0